MRANYAKLIGMITLLATSLAAHAGGNILSITLDNDLFVQHDDGYTNGLYVALFERGPDDSGNQSTKPAPSFWVRPMLWSLPSEPTHRAIRTTNIGQTLFTPSDISTTTPDPNDIPYSAMISLTSSYIAVVDDHADIISTSVGVVGPIAMGEQSQKLVHKLLSSEEPQGWDSQIHNELVFQFSRGRAWRPWAAELDNYDLLATAKAQVGTLKSSVSSSVMVRYGRDLTSSFPSVLLMSSRTSNPIAMDGEWYVYTALQTEYVFNQIFTDGNTFRDSASVDYRHQFIGLNFGVSYSWGRNALTFAVNRSELFQGSSDRYQQQTKYGTLTYSYAL